MGSDGCPGSSGSRDWAPQSRLTVPPSGSTTFSTGRDLRSPGSGWLFAAARTVDASPLQAAGCGM
jgi:hypothetical protein